MKVWGVGPTKEKKMKTRMEKIAKGNAAMRAAKSFAAWLRKNGYGEPTVWGPEKIKVMGWGSATADAAVCLEGMSGLAEMQVWERGWFEKGMQPVEGCNCEPYSEWLMYFYNDGDDSQFRCTECGRIGTVGRCCGRDTQEAVCKG